MPTANVALDAPLTDRDAIPAADDPSLRAVEWTRWHHGHAHRYRVHGRYVREVPRTSRIVRRQLRHRDRRDGPRWRNDRSHLRYHTGRYRDERHRLHGPSTDATCPLRGPAPALEARCHGPGRGRWVPRLRGERARQDPAPRSQGLVRGGTRRDGWTSHVPRASPRSPGQVSHVRSAKGRQRGPRRLPTSLLPGPVPLGEALPS